MGLSGLHKIALALGLLALCGASPAQQSTEISPRAESTPSGLALDLSGGYTWGSYSTAGQPNDLHSGMALPLFVGYRWNNGIEAGFAGTFGFPQINSPNATEASAFTYTGLGLQAGYRVQPRVSPFMAFFPYARLSQTMSHRLELATVHTDLEYQGQSIGGGLKVYLSNPGSGAVQVGLRFMYMRERYTRASVQSHLEPLPDKPAPIFRPSESIPPEQQFLTGNTYQLGLFIGL